MDTSTKWTAPVYRVSPLKNIAFAGILFLIFLLTKQNLIFLWVFIIFVLLRSINPKKRGLMEFFSFSKNMATHYITENELIIEWKNKKKIINFQNTSCFREDVPGFENLRKFPICKDFDGLGFAMLPGLEYIVYIPRPLKNEIVKELSKHIKFVNAKKQLKILGPMVMMAIIGSVILLILFFLNFKHYIQ